MRHIRVTCTDLARSLEWYDEIGFEVVATAADGNQAITRFSATRPNVVVLDLQIPGPTGVEVTATVLTEDPSARVLILSGHDDEHLLARAVQAGAIGDVLDRLRQAEDVALARAFHDRHDQSVLERDRDAEIDLIPVDDVVAVDGGVHDAVPPQTIHDDCGDERREGELGAHPLVVVLLGLADLVDARVVHFEDGIDVRRGALAEDHVLRNLLAHGIQSASADPRARDSALVVCAGPDGVRHELTIEMIRGLSEEIDRVRRSIRERSF